MAAGIDVPSGYDLSFYVELSESEREAYLPTVEVILAGAVRLTAETQAKCTSLRFIQTLSVGVDGIDLVDATQRRVLVANNPESNAMAVAEHVVLGALYFLRKMGQAQQVAISETFQTDRLQFFNAKLYGLRGMKVGIVGFGGIGREVVRLLAPFRPEILVHSRRPSGQTGVQDVTLHALLQVADVVVLALPLTQATYHLLANEEFALMKEGAILINVGRGALLDSSALASAMQQGRVYGAVLDVFEPEPPGIDHPLIQMAKREPERFLLSPHVSGVTIQSWSDMVKQAFANLERYAQQEAVRHVVGVSD